MENKNQIKRLKKRSEFLLVMKKGKRLFINDWLTLNWMPNPDKETRVGWTVPAYVGTAVVRNRLKRWLKEFLEKKWDGKSASLVLHFAFRRYQSAFYKSLKHEQFDAVIGLGLKNVEKLQQRQPPQAKQ